ncbi:polyhydroxyalkanoic acid system family protein [Aeromonas fluvialis]|uniref:polyhydroxyalkanoic acid system family protein n=1 Tax=Aeromonas fluvialis TaxID=591962 RepID=UPI0005A6D602|nr:polyhydroxyalkanoic acid system family protein [Aeromonas fluvialis]
MFFHSLAGSSALSTIQINRQHPLGLAAARLAAEAIARDMSESYQLECEWIDEEETELQFRGSGVHGTLTLKEDTLALDVHLGLMLMPVRSVLEQEIVDYVDNRLPCPKRV